VSGLGFKGMDSRPSLFFDVRAAQPVRLVVVDAYLVVFDGYLCHG